MRGVLMDIKICVNLCTHVLFSTRLKRVTRIKDHMCHCVSMCPVLILQWSSGNTCIVGAYCRLYAQLFCFFSFILLSLSCNYCCILLLFFITSTCTYTSCNLNVCLNSLFYQTCNSHYSAFDFVRFQDVLHCSITLCVHLYSGFPFYFVCCGSSQLLPWYYIYVVLYIYPALCRTYSDILSPLI